MTAIAIACVVLAVVPGNAEVVGYVFAPVCFLVAWRMWNVGAHVGSEGVKVVGLFLTRRVPWADIERFDVLPTAQYPYVGHIIRKDSRPVMIIAISTARGKTEKHRRTVQAPIDRLNEALDRWRSTQPAR